MGLVIKLFGGSDGKVRAVSLKTSKNGKPVYLNRPIEKLYPVELRSTETITDEDVVIADQLCDEIGDVDENVNDRPRRNAADNGIVIRRLLGYT